MLKLSPILLLVAGIGAGTAARAADCGADMQKLATQRETALKNINEMITSAKGKKLDPELFCVRSRPLNVAEDAMLAYMEKNKDWCQIPDEVISNLKATHIKSVAFGGKACTVAAQIKKMKAQAAQAAAQQQAQGGAPEVQPLPAGPL